MAQRGAASLLLTASGVLCIRDRSRRPSSRSDHGPRSGGPSFPDGRAWDSRPRAFEGRHPPCSEAGTGPRAPTDSAAFVCWFGVKSSSSCRLCRLPSTCVQHCSRERWGEPGGAEGARARQHGVLWTARASRPCVPVCPCERPQPRRKLTAVERPCVPLCPRTPETAGHCPPRCPSQRSSSVARPGLGIGAET